MLTKNDFAASDWNTLRETPYLVGLATMLAEPSGLGTIKETVAMTVGMVKEQSSDIPLIRDLTSRPELQGAQESIKARLGELKPSSAKDTVRTLALDHARSSIELLDEHAAGAQEINAYKKLLYGLAETVANASREGGVLGFGGKPVSAAEQSFLDELQSAIQYQKTSKA